MEGCRARPMRDGCVPRLEPCPQKLPNTLSERWKVGYDEGHPVSTVIGDELTEVVPHRRKAPRRRVARRHCYAGASVDFAVDPRLDQSSEEPSRSGVRNYLLRRGVLGEVFRRLTGELVVGFTNSARELSRAAFLDLPNSEAKLRSTSDD